MPVLTDLPTELLLSIIAEVSPLDLDSFVLSCKRLYDLRLDTVRAHNLIRTSILNECPSPEFLCRVFEDPKLALYPLIGEFFAFRRRGSVSQPDGAPISDDLLAEINMQIPRIPYTASLENAKDPYNELDLIVPLLMTRLLNLRELRLTVITEPRVLETVSNIVEASHGPTQRPLPLGKLTEANIIAGPVMNLGMEMTILLAMIPTLRKLKATHLVASKISCPHDYQSEVTDMCLDGWVDLPSIIELIRRSYRLQRFEYTLRIYYSLTKAEYRRLADILKERAGHSLQYLGLYMRCPQNFCRSECSKGIDMSLGSLRKFTVLKRLAACVDMFIKLRYQSKSEHETGTVQRLVSWLPASLETLDLYPGLEKWDADVLRKLFRGLRNNKQRRVPNLKIINFMAFPNFDLGMPDDIKAACQATGIKVKNWV